MLLFEFELSGSKSGSVQFFPRKAVKDHITLLLGNASDLKLKPLVVYHSETLRAMNGYSKLNLSVFWQSNKMFWITRTVFQDWFTSCFCPAVKEYFQAKNLENRVLLLLDNAPGHPTNLDDLTDNIKVAFMPPNIQTNY